MKRKTKISTPLVSVVMPVYNAEKYLSQAIESILNQTYKNFEFIIIDDCSTDKSWEIIQKYAKKDKRINSFKNKNNLGQSKTVLKGINIAKGEYFLKFDNDDISAEDRIEKEVNFMEENRDYVVVGSNLKIINEENQVIGIREYPKKDEEIRKIIYYKSPFAYPAICIRKKAIDKVNYPTIFKYTDDYLLWWRLLKIGKGYNLDDFLVSYRIHSTQVKNKSLKIQLKETLEVQKIIFRESKPPLKAKIINLILKILFFLPGDFVLWLFKKVEYKKV